MYKNSSETTKSFFDNMANAQKKMYDSWTSAADTFKKNVSNNETSEKSADYFQKWYDSQMAFFNNPAGEFAKAASAANFGSNPMDFYTNWYNSQMKLVEDWYVKAQEAAKTAMDQAKPYMPEEVRNNLDNTMNTYNTWSETMKKTFQDMSAGLKNGFSREAFAGMFNNNDMYMKMYSMFSPLMSAIQNKTFTPDMMKNLVSPEAYKEMLDKMFNFAPEQMKEMYEKNMALFTGNMKKAMESGKTMFNSMKENNMFDKSGETFFTNMLNQYQSMNDSMKNGMSPFMKMMTPGADRNQLESLADISDKMALYSIKNAQMQYMTYTVGNKALEAFGEKIYSNMKEGVEYKDFMALYNEWLSINDTVYVELFSTEEYSKLQAELSTLSLTLKKEMSGQLEKMLVNVPVVPRSEMDELYKTVYELKKKVNSLEKQLEETARATANTNVSNGQKAEESTADVNAKNATKSSAKKPANNSHN